MHHKPIGLLNVNGFFNDLLPFLDHAVEQKLLSQSARRILLSAPTADELIDQLQAFVSEPDPKLALIDWSNKPSSKRSRLDLSLSL
ncbi:LOG family protein [Proteus mirabilis]|uniref:LOG family protein n=1 Tax=Proteus mirabilis TaxID=584 RepID=UPI0034D3FA93